MKNGWNSLIAVAVFLIAVFLPACKPDNIDLSSPAAAESSQLVSISISPAAPSMAPGTQLQLEAVGTFANNTIRKLTENVTWTSSETGIATVDGAGLVSSMPVSSGTATIAAASGTVTGSTVITISPPVSIAVTPAVAVIAPGTTQQFTARATLQNSAVQDVTPSATWQSSSAAATISQNGTALAVPGLTGTATITATFGGIAATASLTTADVRSISVAPFNPKVVLGTTQQFTAIATLSNFATQNITPFATWSTSAAAVAIVNAAGLAAAVSPGSAFIAASFGNASGLALLTVTAPSIVSISVSPTSQTIAPGGSVQFTATATFSDGSRQDITADATWSTSNTDVVIIDNLQIKGAAVAVGKGTAEITAFFAGVASNAVVVTVTQQVNAIASIVVTPAAPSIPAGTSIQFKATALSSTGTTLQDLTSAATWSSSNSTVAFVSQGLATGLAAGTTTITATSGTMMGTAVLIVTPF